MGRTEGPPQSGEEDRVPADQLSVLPRLTALERGTQHRLGLTLVLGERLQRKKPPDRVRPARKRRTHPAVPNLIPFSGAGELRHLTAAGRDTILGHASAASRRVIFDGRQESSNESLDRTWRRWGGYCDHVGYGSEPLLALLSDNERDLFLRAFLDFYRQADWDANGKPAGRRREPVVASTLRKTASNLASFESEYGPPIRNSATSIRIREIADVFFHTAEVVERVEPFSPETLTRRFLVEPDPKESGVHHRWC
jgi:hypothetical protein